MLYCVWIGFTEFKMTRASLASDFVYFLYSYLAGMVVGSIVSLISCISSHVFVILLYRSSKSD